MDARIETARHWFQRIYLGGIPQMIRDETAFLSFICTLSAIEALAGYRYPATGDTARPGARFQRFVSDYFGQEYSALASDLWNFRNGMIHGFCPRRFALTHYQSHRHLQTSSDSTTFLNAEDFYAALVQASGAFFQELEGSTELQENFLARLNSSQGGGIAVGPVEAT